MMKLPPLPELSPEEKAMNLSKYYLPVSPPDPLRQQLIDAGPMDPADAIPAEHFLDLLMEPEVYNKIEHGYCMMPDGSGYIALYERSDPRVTGEMNRWYLRWMNFRPKSSVPGQGNLKYKLWMPLDHMDHEYINGKDNSEGIRTLETLDLGAGSKPIWSVHHRVNVRDYGVTEEMEKELKEKGYSLRIAWESFEIPGSHFCVSLTRPCPLGGTETLSREWIGWRPENGRVVRDAQTPCDEEFLRNVVIHNTIEHEHLPKFLPAMWAEYKDQPLDAD